jgi:hypothetical protein
MGVYPPGHHAFLEDAMADAFATRADDVSAPARYTVAVTPSDTTDLTDLPKAIYVGGGGDIALMAAADNTARIFKAAQAGSILPIRARRILVTGTTATNLIALY